MSDRANYSNNPKAKHRRDTKFQVVYPTIPSITQTPRSIVIHQKQYQHDVLVLSYLTTSNLWAETLKTGVPIKVSWTQGGFAKEWYGYVSFVSKTNAPQQREQHMDIHCIGSSFPLKERVNRVFTNTTIPEAVATIAAENGFNFIGDKEARRFSQLNIVGHSYWEWIVEQAKKIGFVFFVDGTDLYFKSLDSYLDSGMYSLPLFQTSQQGTVYNSQLLDTTLDSIVVLQGEYLEDTENIRAEKFTGGVDPVTAQPYISSSNPIDVGTNLRTNVSDVFFKDYRSDQVTESNAATLSSSSGASTLARLNMPAKIKGQGDPRIRPFTPIQVLGTGEYTDGYWVVKNVTHVIKRDDNYNVEMDVVTDGTGSNTTSSFRGQQSSTMSTVNIPKMVSESATLENFSKKTTPVLNQVSPVIVPTSQGYRRTPAYWTAYGRGA
jgi:phage protein D